MSIIHLRPTEAEPVENNRTHYSFDISQPDAGGFVLIDACVPMSLAVEFMNLLTTYKPD